MSVYAKYGISKGFSLNAPNSNLGPGAIPIGIFEYKKASPTRCFFMPIKVLLILLIFLVTHLLFGTERPLSRELVSMPILIITKLHKS